MGGVPLFLCCFGFGLTMAITQRVCLCPKALKCRVFTREARDAAGSWGLRGKMNKTKMNSCGVSLCSTLTGVYFSKDVRKKNISLLPGSKMFIF